MISRKTAAPSRTTVPPTAAPTITPSEISFLSEPISTDNTCFLNFQFSYLLRVKCSGKKGIKEIIEFQLNTAPNPLKAKVMMNSYLHSCRPKIQKHSCKHD